MCAYCGQTGGGEQVTETNTNQDKRTGSPSDEKRWYNLIYAIVVPIVRLLYPLSFKGRENIPDGPAVVCGNHSNLVDPILVAASFGKKTFMHFIAKQELSGVPVVGWALAKAGVCFVNRGQSDIGAMRSMMKLLKRGDKIFIFPEGTRVGEDNMVDAKTGAVRLASKLRVPIVPVYIPRRKKLFSRVHLIIGEPYYVEGHNHNEYEQLADDIMERIYELRDGESA